MNSMVIFSVFYLLLRINKTFPCCLLRKLEQLQKPWMDMVYQWVTNGVLVDPCDEFFIKSNLNVATISHTTFIDVVKEPCTPHDASLTLDPLFYWKHG
jgi:hypothetical protein